MATRCVEDCSAAASLVCLCAFPVAGCCAAHREKHATKAGLHFLLPAEVADRVQTELEFLQLQGWLFTLTHGQKLLSAHSGQLDALEKQVDSVYDRLLQTFTALRAESLRRIRGMKQRFGELLQECEEETAAHRLEQRTYEPVRSLTKLLWQHSPGVCESLRLFECSVEVPEQVQFPVKLATVVPELREFELEEGPSKRPRLLGGAVQSPAEESAARQSLGLLGTAQSPAEESTTKRPLGLLASLGKDSLRVFDCSTRQWRKSKLSRSGVDAQYSCTLLVDAETVFCCGGSYQDMKQAVFVRMNGTVQSAASMLQGHVMPAGAVLGSTVYVFGGSICPSFFAAHRICEAFSLADKQWQMLPNMQQKRYGASACVHGMRIFICGGYANSVEVFDPQVRTFAQLCSLDSELTERPCLAAVHEEFLVVLSGLKLFRWHFAAASLSSQRCVLTASNSASPAVVLGDFLYFLPPDEVANCQSVDLKSGDCQTCDSLTIE